MVIRSSLFDVMSPGRRTTRTRSARGVQCAALAGANGSTLANDAARFAAMGCGLSADAALVESGVFRGYGARSAGAVRAMPDACTHCRGARSRTLQSTPESGARAVMTVRSDVRGAGPRGSRHAGELLALHVTSAMSRIERSEQLAEAVQQITGQTVELAYVDQGYTGKRAAEAAQAHGIQLEVIKHTEAKRGFILLPRRWVVERSFAWAARFRRLARDYERLGQTLAGFHYLAFACLMLHRIIPFVSTP